jgi:hypothetical protein
MLTALLILAIIAAFTLGRVSTWAWIRTRPTREISLHGAHGKFQKAKAWEVS